MTSLAALHGVGQITHENKLKYDIEYYKRMSFLLDLKIIILTPFAIIKFK